MKMLFRLFAAAALASMSIGAPLAASTVAFALTDQPGAHPIRHTQSAIYIKGSVQPREDFDLDQTYHAGDVMTVTGNVENWGGILPTLYFSTDGGDFAASSVTATGAFSVTITLTADATQVRMSANTSTTATVDEVVILAN